MIKPQKLLGQHFLRCRWVISALIKAAEISKDDIVLEIGPGTGVLTRELAKYAKSVVAVEKDRDLAERLRLEEVPNVSVITDDILRILANNQLPITGNYKVIANIPYYLTSRLFRLLLETGPRPERIVVTIQKEVADRMTAKPPRMNILALSAQIFGNPKVIKKVPRGCFSPPPKVESAIINVSDISDIRLKKAGVTAEQFFKTAKALFASPRKTILNNLSAVLGRQPARKILEDTGTDPHKRAEELNMNDIVRLAIEAEPL